MTATDPNTQIDRATEESDEQGFDVEQLKEVLGFIWRAPARRPKLAALTFVTIATIGLTLSATIPRTYNSEVKLLAQRDLVASALSNPGRSIPREADNPTRNAAATILRRDNLVALVREANLLERWRASRSAALRLKDAVLGLLLGPPRDEDAIQGLAQALEKKMAISTDENSVTISIDWNDPRVAFELVQLVQKNFVDARYDADVTAIQDAIGVLEDHAKTELEEVDSALAAYQTLTGGAAVASALTGAAPTAPTSGPTARKTPPAAASQTTGALPVTDAELTKALEDKRRQIRVLEDERQRTLDALKQQLAQAQVTLTPMHPTVIALQQQLDSISEPPPRLAILKSEERAIMAQIAPATPGAAPVAARPFAVGAAVGPRTTTPAAIDIKSVRDDPAWAPTRSKLDGAILRYQETMARIEGAKLELDITRTAFRYRYSVITPAELARWPKKPIGLYVGVASVGAAIVLALLGAAAADWRAGRVLETWQVRRRLKLDVLGEFELPP